MNQARIDYVLYHLSLQIDLAEIRDFIKYGNKLDCAEKAVFFPESTCSNLELEKILHIGDIPVLFPVSQKKEFYHISGKSVIFEHDILRSIFYLLSGKQELKDIYSEPLNKFSWQESIQKKLGITEKPIVNYYFESVISAIEEFCRLNEIKFKRKNIFTKPLFFMSHDVDRVQNYNFARFKMFLKKGNLLKAGKILTGIFFKLKDPWWNFDYILNLEKKYDISSTWFFLEKGLRHLDAYYSCKDQSIRDLIDKIIKEGHEIGIHGTIESAFKEEVLIKNLNTLNSVCKNKVSGIRQHWLNYYPLKTARIQNSAGLKYDSTLGFHDHIGFRNSFCLPFKPYDFENESIIDIWEIPLVFMDASAFDYQKIKQEEIFIRIKLLQEEIKKFTGIFSILVHNNFIGEMDKKLRNERENFYISLLKGFEEAGYKNETGNKIINLIDR